MVGPAPVGLRQVALAAGQIDETMAFWGGNLGLPAHARFDPPGIAFIIVGGIRLFFAPANGPATVYLDVPSLDAFCKHLDQCGIKLAFPPARLHVDAAGQFGPAGEAEWMAFVKDPAGNMIGLVERRAE